MKTRIAPRCICLIVATVSVPCSRGGSKSNSSPSFFMNVSFIRSQIPIVRSPWTFECPRTGHGPAPGRPIFPPSRRKFMISWIVATAFRCWVNPMAQQPEIAEPLTLAEQQTWNAQRILQVLRILEPEIADLRHRIDRDNLCSRFLRLLQAVQHARVIRSRILADDKDRVRLHEIRQLDAAFADPNHFLQCRATRFVAHVRAVGQIVCSKLTSEQLIEKRSLIARPAACVKGGRIGTRKCVELKCNQLKRIVPRD